MKENGWCYDAEEQENPMLSLEGRGEHCNPGIVILAVQWSEFINFKELQSIDQEYATFFICQKVMDRSVWTCPMECGLMNYKELVKNMSYFYHCVRDCDFSFFLKKKIYHWNASRLSKELLAFFCKSIFFFTTISVSIRNMKGQIIYKSILR